MSRKQILKKPTFPECAQVLLVMWVKLKSINAHLSPPPTTIRICQESVSRMQDYLGVTLKSILKDTHKANVDILKDQLKKVKYVPSQGPK